jgi:hypothetical protein
MTTLDTLSTADPAVDEVADAALAMADFDAKSGDYKMALDWLGVAAHHRDLAPEYTAKRGAWETASAARASFDIVAMRSQPPRLRLSGAPSSRARE